MDEDDKSFLEIYWWWLCSLLFEWNNFAEPLWEVWHSFWHGLKTLVALIFAIAVRVVLIALLPVSALVFAVIEKRGQQKMQSNSNIIEGAQSE